MDNVTKYMTQLFRTISGCQNTEGKYDFSQLEKICFGYPTYTPTCQKAYCETLEKIISDACSKVFTASPIQITCSPEPVLAALAYNEANKKVNSYKQRIHDGDIILVVDLGGYTLDMTILTASKDELGSVSLFHLTASESIESGRSNIRMGKEITKDICSQIYRDSELKYNPPFVYEVEEQKCRFFDNPNTPTAATLLKTVSEEEPNIKKFALIKDHLDANSVIGDTVYVGIYSSNSGRTINIQNSYIQCVKHINNYIALNAHRMNNKKISHVIFTGGTSKINELRDTIINLLCCEFVTDPVNVMLVDSPIGKTLTIKKANDNKTNEKLSSTNVVALGAAVVASQGMEIGKPGGEYASADTVASSNSHQRKFLKLKNKYMTLVNMIVGFRNSNCLCENCISEFDKLLEDIDSLD